MGWFSKPDVVVKMFTQLDQRCRLHVDALGRPYVLMWGSEVELLKPQGRTQSGREWIPLTPRAARVWEAAEPLTASRREGRR